MLNPTKPKSMRWPDGSRKYAFVTFIMMNDSFLPGALMTAYGLRKGDYDADLVCMITENISARAREALELLFDHVVKVKEIYIHHRRRQSRQDRPFLFTRFHALRLGADGDLGFKYEKIVMLDCDVYPLKHYHHLFTLNTPAGTVNERREYCLQYDEQGQYILPENVLETGKWKWHEVYDHICPHGSRIPEEICQRVKTDPSNMGVNSSLLVLSPSIQEFYAIMEDVKRPEILEFIGDIFNWPEMQYATIRWSGQWTNVDLIFNGFGGYPSIDLLFGLHYAGFKPWSFKQRKKLLTLGRHADFQFWYSEFMEMVSAYPRLYKFKRIQELMLEIYELQTELGM